MQDNRFSGFTESDSLKTSALFGPFRAVFGRRLGPLSGRENAPLERVQGGGFGVVAGGFRGRFLVPVSEGLVRVSEGEGDRRQGRGEDPKGEG